MIQESNGKYNFICINTARRKLDEKIDHSKEAFAQKTFKQECDDVYKAYLYLVNKKILNKSQKLIVIGNSFGGTTLLGISELINKSSTIIMIGSGCGKSSTTIKPLLKTLFNEKKLLKTISEYKGIFVFVRGSDDKVVPKESQDKIVGTVSGASKKIVYTIQYAQHNLSNSLNSSTKNRKKTLSLILDHSISLVE
jgi:dienelactone hydrolase